MNQQSFDVAASLTFQTPNDASAQRSLLDADGPHISDFSFAHQLQNLTQTRDSRGELHYPMGKTVEALAHLLTQPEMPSDITPSTGDLTDGHLGAAMPLPQQTISTSTWQAWLEDQVSDAQENTSVLSVSLNEDLKSLQGESRPGERTVETLSVSQWAQTQSALLRPEVVSQDSSSTRASASSFSTTVQADQSQQQQLSIDVDSNNEPRTVPTLETDLSVGDDPSVLMRFSTRPFDRGAELNPSIDAPIDDALVSTQATVVAKSPVEEESFASMDDRQMPLWATTDASTPGKVDAETAAYNRDESWDFDAQTRLAQALPIPTPALVSGDASFADRLSDFAAQAPEGDKADASLSTPERDMEVASAPRQGVLDDSAELSAQRTVEPGQAQQPKSPEDRVQDLSAEAMGDPAHAEAPNGRSPGFALHKEAMAAKEDDTRLFDVEGDRPVGKRDPTDVEPGVAAAQLLASPLAAPVETTGEGDPSTALSSRRTSQGLEAYNSRALRNAVSTDANGEKAPGIETAPGLADVSGQAPTRNKAVAGFASTLHEESDVATSAPATATNADAAATLSARGQILDGALAADTKATAPSATEGSQAAAMTTTVTPARLSAQLAANLSDGARRIQLRVAPPGLGTLDIGVHLQGAQVHLTVRGDQPDLTRFMQEGMNDLQKNLQQHGLDLGNTDFRGGEGDADGSADPKQAHLPHVPKATSAPGRTPAASPRGPDAHVINVLL